jgi:hypothetical protein
MVTLLIIDSSFVRRAFYLDPPTENASKEDWAAWIKADDQEARAAKSAYTKACKCAEKPEELEEGDIRKIGGVWRQCMCLGFGDSEEETIRAELVVKANQEHHVALVNMEKNRHKRGGKGRSSKARRQAKKEAK